MEPELTAPGLRSHHSRAILAISATLFAVIAVLGIIWAKWDPYTYKLIKLLRTRVWSGSSILDSAGKAGTAPSWHAAWSFAVSYGKSVWIALVAALIIAASIDALLPRERVVAALTRRTQAGGALVAGLLAIPCMMCTCCSAPLAVNLKRQGVPTASVLSYWLGNPVLNPAVLAFLALVAPWQWVATRIVVGVVLVFGLTAVIARVADTRAGPGQPAAEYAAPGAFDLAGAPMRFVRAFTRLALTLVPEYVVVVLLLGAFRGWLFPFDGANAAHWGVLAAVIAAVAGTLLVIPTAGEIPILQGLAALGAGLAPIGVLLITLPAVSLPSMAMLGRALTWRVVAVTGTAVALAGLAGGALLIALG